MKPIIDSNGIRHAVYADYLKSKHWNMMKHKARLEYGYICSHCSENDCVLHLHHKTYKRVGNENIDDLMFLCADCHSKEHNRLKTIKSNKNSVKAKNKTTKKRNKSKRNKKNQKKQKKKKSIFPIDNIKTEPIVKTLNPKKESTVKGYKVKSLKPK